MTRKRTWSVKNLHIKKCPCKGKYISPSKGKCPGKFQSISALRKSWMPGCLDYILSKRSGQHKKFLKYCGKSNGGCGKPFSTLDEERIICEDCESLRGAIDIHWLISIGFLGLLVGIGIVFFNQVQIFLEQPTCI